MKYVPFHIERLVWSRDFCKVFFGTLGPDAALARSGKFALGTPSDLIEFLKEHGSCSFCSATIADGFEKCHCGKPRGLANHLVIQFPAEIHQDFKKIFDREYARVKATRRAAMIRENGGAFDKKHIKGMHAAQRGLCYYCGAAFGQGTKVLHVDHYKPVSMGGSDDLDNRVLACSSCNLRKNAMDGLSFDAKLRKVRSPQISAILREIRRDLKAYKKAQVSVSAPDG